MPHTPDSAAATPLAGRRLRHWMRRFLSCGASLLGAALIGGLGWTIARNSLSLGTVEVREATAWEWLWIAAAESLARLSYDLPFLFRNAEIPDEIVMVYVSENSAGALGQSGSVWDRKLFTDLLVRINQDQPRGVIFDVVFHDAWPEPGVDEAFAEAIKENGRVFLAAGLETNAGAPSPSGFGFASQKILAPLEMLEKAAAGWGVAYLQPLDGDFGIRRLYCGDRRFPSLAWAAAQKLGGSLNEKMRVAAPVRWLNYLAPGDSFPSLDFHLALVAPERTFHDRLVVIGSRSTLSGVGMGKDDFRNPYNLLGGAFSTGAEVHTTALLNLLHGDWMNRLNPRWEVWLVTGIGLFLGGVLPRFRPHTAALLAAGSIAGIVTLAWWLLAMHRIWFAWGVAALVLVPAALVWAVGARYFIEERRRSALRDGFGHYLPAHIVDRIADSDFDLAPGGAVCEASVLFTDLEGFTALSENLQSPEVVTSILLKYFAQTSQPILENDGLILNFVGDAMTAVWGVPLATADHAKRATMAAWQLHQSAHIDIGGRTLRTRVGLHTGKVLAGNVGSAKRFDYAVIGDPANLASRLEGLNKFLGTDVLISEAIRALVADSFTTRCVGEFRVLGKKEACRVHELLGPASSEKPAAWEDSFADALRAFGAGNLPAAEIGMSKTLAERGGTDGPSQFYLRHIARLKGTELPPDWTGVIEFTEK